jgi:hypothetical protein
LGRRLFTPMAGVAAAAAYALLSVSAGVFGTQAHATHFVVAAALGGTLLMLQAVETGSAAVFFWSGLCYGVAILMKQNGAVFALFGGLYVLWKCRRKVGMFVLGAAVPLALTALFLWHAGVFARFWFWTVTYARAYAGETSIDGAMAYFTGTFPKVVGPNLLLWILAAAGLVRLWWKADLGLATFTTAFLLFSFLAVCPGWYFREHYFVLMLPAIALLAGAAVSSGQRVEQVVFGVILVISIALQRDFLFRYRPLEASRQMYGYTPFPEAIEIGKYLRAHTDKDARIAVMGSEPEIYFYAGRRSASGYIYTYGMMEPQPYALAMQEEMVRDMENARPEYVVFINMQSSWARRPDSQVKIDDWWNTFSSQNYDLAGVADILSPDRTEYHWDHLEAYRERPALIAVYRRKAK